MPPPDPLPPQLLNLAEAQAGLVSSQQCERWGVKESRRRRNVARGRWQRVARGVYDIALGHHQLPLSQRLDLMRKRAAWTGLLAHGPTAVAVGPCALALHGVRGLPATLTPEVVLPGRFWRPGRDGIVVRTYDTEGAVMPLRSGAPWHVATPEAALAQAIPQLPPRRAVAVLDSALHLGLVDPGGIEMAQRLARGRRGVRCAQQWWALADGRAASPLETWARLDCIAAGVPPDELQVELFDAEGRFLGRGDMGWRLPDGRWLIAEVDGAEFHDGLDAAYNDRARHNRMQSAGNATILRFTARDLRVPGRVGGQIRRFLQRERRTREQG